MATTAPSPPPDLIKIANAEEETPLVRYLLA